LRDQIGYETRRVDDSPPWVAGGTVLVMVGVGAGLRLGRRLP
jgi:Ca-activated chloride channel homolog